MHPSQLLLLFCALLAPTLALAEIWHCTAKTGPDDFQVAQIDILLPPRYDLTLGAGQLGFKLEPLEDERGFYDQIGKGVVEVKLSSLWDKSHRFDLVITTAPSSANSLEGFWINGGRVAWIRVEYWQGEKPWKFYYFDPFHHYDNFTVFTGSCE